VPAIPHDLDGRADCLACHAVGTGMKPAPANHAERTVETCQGCHQAAASPAATPPATTPTEEAQQPEGQAQAIPHDLDGRADCLACHAVGSGMKPAPANHAGRTAETCQACHKANEEDE
jgi:hypothetical protein